MSAIRHAGSEDELRTSYGKLGWEMPQHIMEFGPALTLQSFRGGSARFGALNLFHHCTARPSPASTMHTTPLEYAYKPECRGYSTAKPTGPDVAW